MSKLKRSDGTLELDHRVVHKDHNSRLQQLLGCNPTTDNLEKIKYQGKQWMSSWPRRDSCYHQTRSGWRLRDTADTAVHLLWVSLASTRSLLQPSRSLSQVQQSELIKRKRGERNLPLPETEGASQTGQQRTKIERRGERWNSEIDWATENYAPERKVIYPQSCTDW